MEVGKLRHRIACDEPITTRNDIGEAIVNFVEVFRVRGRVEPLNGRERLLANQITAVMDTRICIRWSPNTDRITAQWRLRHDGVTYNISAPPAHIDMARREIEIMCSSGLNAG